MTHLIQRYPLVFSLVLVLSALLVDVYSGVVIGHLAGALTIAQLGSITGGIVALGVAVLVQVLHWWRMIGFRSPRQWGGLLWFLPFVLYGFLPLGAGVTATPGTLLVGIMAGFLIAFWKLSVLGILLAALAPWGKWARVGISAVLFGVMHLGGILAGGHIAPTIMLSVSYAFLAVAYGSLVVRTGALWPAVLTYGVFLASAFAILKSAAPNLATDVSSILPAVFAAVVLAVYGLIALSGTPASLAPREHAPSLVTGTEQNQHVQ
ncbi:MAG: hypothetical protein H0X24_12205 [Ktedonobacterales bacterium]|nr:hypothetical protein [Ktedonobacterales bacterium]